MSLDPESTGVVQLEYSVPAKFVAGEYQLVVQKQPGLDLADFEFTIQKGTSGVVEASEPRMTEWPDSWRLHSSVEQDLEISVRLK